MTQIDFYTHSQDKLATACQLTAKALERGFKVLIYTPNEAVTEKLDRLLWSVPSTGFLPHCRAVDPLAAITPVIVDHLAEPLLHDEILVNLRPECPPFFSRFQRVIEVVGTDPEDSQAGRRRFRFYRDRGYEIRHFNVAPKGSPDRHA